MQAIGYNRRTPEVHWTSRFKMSHSVQAQLMLELPIQLASKTSPTLCLGTLAMVSPTLLKVISRKYQRRREFFFRWSLVLSTCYSFLDSYSDLWRDTESVHFPLEGLLDLKSICYFPWISASPFFLMTCRGLHWKEE